jgi:ribulose-phosphate 3-epimerase
VSPTLLRELRVAPSILSADFARLGSQVEEVLAAGARVIHVDVMDGHFVPNITVGLPVVRSLARATRLPLDTHLMISEPGRYAEQFAEAGARMVSIHIEVDPHIHRTLASIRKRGAKAGVVINPATSLSALDEVLNFVDYVLVMSVNPGFGGQEFIPTSVEKVRRLSRTIRERNLDVRIEVDGGIGPDNIARVAAAGAEIFVAGTAVFGHDDPAAATRDLLNAAAQLV